MIKLENFANLFSGKLCPMYKKRLRIRKSRQRKESESRKVKNAKFTSPYYFINTFYLGNKIKSMGFSIVPCN